jgi:parallel beta-helix repeat protein
MVAGASSAWPSVAAGGRSARRRTEERRGSPAGGPARGGWFVHLEGNVIAKRLALIAVMLANTVLLGVTLAAPLSVGAAAYNVSTAGTDSTTCGVAPNPPCRTIQYTIDNRAGNGDTIVIAAGTYEEQVLIDEDLTIAGAGQDATIIKLPTPPPALTASPTLSSDLAIVEVTGGAVVTMSGVTVAGPWENGDCGFPGGLYFDGVLVVGGATLNLSNSAVRDIRITPQSNFGCQTGYAIVAGFDAAGGTANLTNVTVTGYQKSGVLVDGTDSSLTLTNSTITGVGATTAIAQNGVQISNEATATITGNTISGNLCDNATCGPDYANKTFAGGILLLDAGNVTIENNTIANNDVGLDIEGGGGPITISNNAFTANRFEGILIGGGTATISGNEFSGPSNIGVLIYPFPTSTDPNAPYTCTSASATLTNNRIADATTGVRILDPDTGDGCGATGSGSNNSFAGTTTGVDNDTAGQVDFRNNYWGSPNGPQSPDNPGGNGATEEGNVLFGPWLREGTDTSTARGFQPTAAKAGLATKLVFVTQPGGAQPGQPLNPQPVVQAQDADGNPAINFNGPVSLALGTNPTGASLGGTTTVTAAGGTASFTNVSVDRAGTGYTLAASATGLTSVTSNPFTVATPPPPSPSPVASVSPTSLTFANQTVGTTSASQPVTLRNTGGAPLAINVITTSGDFAQTNNCQNPLPAGQSCTINVTFTPVVAGSRSGNLTIFTNAAGSPHNVTLSGTGVAPASPSPAPATYTVTVSRVGAGTVSPGTGTYTAGSTASFTAQAAAGQVFLGWTLDGQYVGFASPLTFTVDGNRSLVAQFAARPTFSDVPASDPDHQAITFLAAAGIINPQGVNGSGRFEPGREVARAEVAAFVARVFGWDDEFHASRFPDRCDPQGQNCVDDELWNNVGALADYGVVGGYTDAATCRAAGFEAPCYLPRDPVKRVQIVSIVARAFIKQPDLRPTGFWDRRDADPAQYTNVPDEGTQRSDLTTYRANAGQVPGTSADDRTFVNPEDAASRRYVIQVLYQAFAAQYGTDRVP